MTRRRPTRGLALVVVTLTVLTIGDGVLSVAPAAARASDALSAEVASYDIAVGLPARFAVGLFTADHRFIGWGHVDMRFHRLGAGHRSRAATFGATRRGHFLAVPGVSIRRPPRFPTVLPASRGRGVYAVDVGFDRPGFWQVEVRAAVGGGPIRTTTAAFAVLAAHEVPTVGDVAPLTTNLTLASPGVPLAAVDSRASNGTVPDPVLHATTIPAAVLAHRPVLVVFSTPTFCTSRMCGPVTDMVERLAREYADRAAFIHVEIWKDFEHHVVNDAATAWLAHAGNDLREPWVFLIGADGRIAARWDNVVTRAELEPTLRQLPATGPS